MQRTILPQGLLATPLAFILVGPALVGGCGLDTEADLSGEPLASQGSTSAYTRPIIEKDVSAGLTAVDFGDGTFVFANVTAPAFLRECVVETVSVEGGNCLVQTCPSTLDPPIPRSAGKARVSGLFDAVLEPLADGTYPFIDDPRILWNGGEQLRFSFAGDLSRLPVVLPAAASVEAPPKDVSITSTLPEIVGTTLDLAWSGGAASNSQLEVVLQSGEQSIVTEDFFVPTISADCRFPLTAQTASVPPFIVEKIPPGPGLIVLQVLSERRRTVLDQKFLFNALSFPAGGGTAEVVFQR